jgi:hypothetical protein
MVSNDRMLGTRRTRTRMIQTGEKDAEAEGRFALA